MYMGNANGHKNIYIFCTKQHRHALLGCVCTDNLCRMQLLLFLYAYVAHISYFLTTVADTPMLDALVAQKNT